MFSVCTKPKWKIKLRFKYYWSRLHNLEKSDFNSIRYKAASTWKFKCLLGWEQLQSLVVSGSDGHSTCYSEYAVTLNSTHFHCPSSPCRKPIFPMEQYYFLEILFLQIYRGRLLLQCTPSTLPHEVFVMFIEVLQMYRTRNVSAFWAHSLRDWMPNFRQEWIFITWAVSLWN